MAMINGTQTILPVPDGYQADFDHPKRQAVVQTYVTVAVGNFFALLFLAQKIYTRLFLDRKLQLDDGCHIAAWATSIATQAVLLRGFATGVIGVHAWEISLAKYDYYSILILLAPVIYAPCTGFAKLTLLILYRRLSPVRWFVWAVNASILVVVGYTIGIFFSLIFACTPIEKSWNATMTTGTCINRPALYITTAALGVATDVVLIVLPARTIIGLQMRLAQKAGLIFIFTVGSATLITSVVRLVILLPVTTDADQPWAIAYPCMWICIEANLMIVCGSLPTLQRFFKFVAPKLMGESSRGQSAGPPEGHAAGLRTFGEGTLPKKNSGYSRFGDSDSVHTDVEMTVLDTTDDDAGFRPDVSGAARSVQVGRSAGKQTSVITSGSLSPRSRRVQGDGESEEGIIQTTTTVIEYGMKR